MLLSACLSLLMACVQLPPSPEPEFVVYTASQTHEVVVRSYEPAPNSARAFPDLGARHKPQTVPSLPAESRALRCIIGVA